MKNNTNGRTIRVLIVDDIPETRENLKKLLFFEGEIEVVGAAANGDDAVRDAQEKRPDVILMDINMPGLDGISAAELIAHQTPEAQVIMMSVQGEADYLRRSMLAGAREFLIKPFSGEELASTIRRVYDLGAPRRASARIAAATPAQAGPPAAVAMPAEATGNVIAVYSPKGGVGCSTFAANLAVALCEVTPAAKVLLVDANLQFGGIEVLLNLQAKRSIVDLAEMIDDLDAELVQSVVSSHTSGIKVLLAPPRPEMADLVNSEHMGKILRLTQRIFNFVVVDTQSALHDLELTIFDVASRVVLLATPQIPAIRNAKMFFDVTSALDYPADKVMLVLYAVDRRTGIRTEDIAASIRHSIAAVMPADERSAFMAVNQGIPLLVGSRSSPASQAILEFARSLSAGLQPQPELAGAAEPRARLLGKLFRSGTS